MLDRNFYNQPTEVVAKNLLGKRLVCSTQIGQVAAWIVEVEAYLAKGDLASHSFRGLTKSNRSMFDKPGTLYVYPIHAKYCMNVVTEPSGTGAAVLLRAMEPIEGFSILESYRAGVDERDLLRGPGKLCQAMNIDRRHDGGDLCQGDTIWIEEEEALRPLSWNIRSSPRIGIRQSVDLSLRFFVDGNRYVSGLARHHSVANRQSFTQLLHEHRQSFSGSRHFAKDRSDPADSRKGRYGSE